METYWINMRRAAFRERARYGEKNKNIRACNKEVENLLNDQKVKWLLFSD